MNNKLIQELKEGKVAVKNDGSLNDLRKVLNYAFPKDDWPITGVPKYYYTYNCFYWQGLQNTDLPSYSVKDFLKEEEFVLPKEWYIIPKTLSELRIVGKWFDESEFGITIDKTFYQNLIPEYLGQPFGGVKKGNVLYNRIGTEVTFEQFKKYVLKEEEMIDKINDEFIVDCVNNTDEERREVYKFLVDNRNYPALYLEYTFPVIVCRKTDGNSNYRSLENAKDNFPLLPVLTFEKFKTKYLKEETMERKVIGYKLIKPEYNDVAVKIAGYPNTAITINEALDVTVGAKYAHTSSREKYITKLKEAGVLDLWFEKVYEEEIKLPTINGYEGKVEGDFVIYGNDCAKFHKGFFKDLLGMNNYKGNRTIAKVTLCSNVIITIEEVEKIVKYLNAKGL